MKVSLLTCHYKTAKCKSCPPFIHSNKEGEREREWNNERKIFLDSIIKLQCKTNFFMMTMDISSLRWHLN